MAREMMWIVPTSDAERDFLAKKYPARKLLAGRLLLSLSEGKDAVRDLVAAGFPDEGDLEGSRSFADKSI